MGNNDKEILADYFEKVKDMDSEQLVAKVSKYLDDEAIEIFVDHIEDFYGVEDDEELGMLTQLMISGFVAAKELGLS
jgi:hypothetical protein